MSQDKNYFEQRMDLLGITPEMNSIGLWQNADKKDGKGVITSDKELKEVPVFRKHEKGLEIIVYTLDRNQPSFVGDGKRWKDKWSIIRLEHPVTKPDGSVMKYQMPKGQGSYPFFPPALVEKYDKKQPIVTLFITEGFIKAFKGAMHGVDVVGVASITHLKSKETGGLHADIIELMKVCKVQRVVWLTDGDALDVSDKVLDPKAHVDLYRRPASFYSSISTFKQLLDDYDVEKYFMHVDSDEIMKESNFFKSLDQVITRDKVKGLDDIMVTFPEKIPEIVEDLKSVSKNGFWFQRFNISTGMSKVRNHFRLHNVNDFILFHQERNPALKNREFIFHGTTYMYNEEKGECDVRIPGDANLYFRVGDEYYEWIMMPNQFNQLEKVFHQRQKTTITDDHGKPFIKYVAKYKAFCNVPSHTNFQQVINACFNVYSKIDYEPGEEESTPEEFASIYAFLHHVFGEKEATFIDPNTKERKTYKILDLCLDYLQLLYLQPWRKLPILCLVSKENNTGKSTFANFLRMLLGSNVAIVGNQDLAGDFNAHWSTKSVVVCDETKIDKQHVIEKIKSLSTARKIWMNAKGRGQIELDCFIKFVLITNNEENFIYAGDDDIRYWVIKVPVLKSENPNILEQFVEEMPAFLSFLQKRKLATENKNRMWFHPDLLKTDALRKVIQHSQPTIQKEIVHKIRDMFFDFGVEEILMTRTAIHKEFFNNKYEANYLEKVLKDNLKVDMYHKLDEDDKDLFDQPKKKYITRRHSYPKWEFDAVKKENVRVDVNDNGRPYVFKREQFLSIEERLMVQVSEENKHINDMSVTTAEEIKGPNDLPFP